ncbi:glycosyltransferase family 4 protein [Owenweeksia hongkongensis]|uniref:glycosyltransferase family 4 protein n=1 Tax=Owenweeksia hongkongensis TaxID=253245 RepID=UPI003A93FFF1
MNITWVTRSFLDYRIPVYAELDKLSGNNLTVIYNAEVVPERCQENLKAILGNRAIGLTGEIRIGGKQKENQTFANKAGIRIPIRLGLINIIKKTKPTIVLSDGFFQWTYAALVLNALFKVRHIMCYERTGYTERNVTFIRKNARKIAARFISGICCNGIETKTYLEKFGFPSEKLFLGNMAADTKGLQLALSKVENKDIQLLKNNYNIKGLVFLYVGQLIERKGVMELLQSWRAFVKEKTNISLLLLGDGNQTDEVQDYIAQYELDSVKLIGKIEYSQVANYYALSDVFIIPTLEDNWSLVVPEAMSCGLPILSSIYNGCWPELVKKENGWVFDPLDENNFIETLEAALEKKDDWIAMGNASTKIVENFSPEIISKKIFDACMTILK